jgi:hypothetical protein
MRRIELGQNLPSDRMNFMNGQLCLQTSHDEARKIISWVFPTPSDGAHVSLASAQKNLRELHIVVKLRH